jgi:hypothetical protein
MAWLSALAPSEIARKYNGPSKMYMSLGTTMEIIVSFTTNNTTSTTPTNISTTNSARWVFQAALAFRSPTAIAKVKQTHYTPGEVLRVQGG